MAAPNSAAAHSRRMTGGDAVVAALVANGIDRLYCLPGVQSDHLFNAIFDAKGALCPIHTRHEQGAAYMALGAALASGKPAVYSVVPGPGFLNTTAALATAYATGARVLCLAGQIPSRAIGKGNGLLHEIPDQIGIMQRLTKWAAHVGSPAEAPALIKRAFDEMSQGRARPVGLEIPPDILAATDIVSTDRGAAAAGTTSNLDLVEAAATLLRHAERPLIFVGGGAIDAAAEVAQISEILRAPVVAYRMGRGIVDDRNPMGMTLPAGHRLWKDCDVALAIGTRFQLPASAWGMDSNLNVVRIDVDREEVDRLPSPAQALIGDARIILRALIDELASARRAPGRARWENYSQATKAAVAAEMQVLDPQLAYLRAIRDVLPDDGVLVDELTQVGYVARVGYEVRRPRTYLSSGYQGTLGWGFATALGAKERLGSTPVVSITGDGGFMFTAQEMATAICHNIPLVTILFNDGAFGNVRRMQEELYGNRVICSHLANPDFRQFIESFGAAFFRATNPAELRVTLAKAIECGRPALIEVPVGPMPSPWKFLELPKVRGA